MSARIPENTETRRAVRKLPCVILVDTSGSMMYEQHTLIEGLEELKNNLIFDEMTCSTVELCIITFNNDALVAEPFGPVSEMNVPDIHCRGITSMHAAVELGLKVIDEQKNEYKESGISFYRPCMYLLTDGVPTDRDNGVLDKLRQLQEANKLSFFPTAIGHDVDMQLLRSLRPDHFVFTVERGCVSRAFDWIYENWSDSSYSVKDAIALPDPEGDWNEDEHILIDAD